MPATKSDKLQLLYQGSVKRVYAAPAQPERLWFAFSDDYSVFDWGKMPDTIANKGRALTLLGAYFFMELSKKEFWTGLSQSPRLAAFDGQWKDQLFKSEAYKRLCREGLTSHFHRLTDESDAKLELSQAAAAKNEVFMEVDRAEVFRPVPATVLGQPIFYYPPVADSSVRRLIPLEVVFRFGMPAGSSLKERLEKNPDYALQLGLQEAPKPDSWFPHPVLEFYTKLEPKDRLLTLPEALNISTLAPEQFNQLCQLASLAAVGLFALFAERDIELWDGKFEFVFSDNQVVLADSIGPDELRLLYQGVHLSKEMIRQFYRDSNWEKSLKKAQKLAAERGSRDWKLICREELQAQPAPLSAEFKQKVDQLYGVLANHVTGQQLFAAHPDLAAFAQSHLSGGKS